MKPLTATLCVLTMLAAACGNPAPGGLGGSAMEIPSPAGAGSAEPHLAEAVDGRVFLSWLEPVDAGTHALKYSTLEHGSWSASHTVAQGARWFVNWADFPSVVPIRDSTMAAHWLVKRPGGSYSYDIAIALSGDGGQSWSQPLTPHHDDTPTEHGFVSLFPRDNGVGVVWLDGRNMEQDPAGHDSGDSPRGGGMTLRHAIVDDTGATSEDTVLDDLVCDCCQTDVAVGSAGPIVVYRDRSETEVRDISVTTHDGTQWSPPRSVAHDGWEIAGCPVNGPAIAAQGDQVAVAWFTASEGKRRVRLARSPDGGRSFSGPIDIAGDTADGRVDVVLTEDHQAIVSWMARTGEGKAEIRVRGVSPEGSPGEARVVAQTSAARSAGFPQMVGHESGLLFAWTDDSEPTRVRVALMEWD